MHIPTCDTALQDIQSFSLALEEALLPQADYDVDRWLYVPNRYCDYRYILGIRGSRPLICVGINPSTAAPNDLDNTLKSVERIALGNGYDSFIMFNVYAQRATRPDDMEKVCNPALHQENMAAFRWALEQTKTGTPAVWAAWGAIIEKRSGRLPAGHGGDWERFGRLLVFRRCPLQKGTSPPSPVPAEGQQPRFL